MKEHAKRLAWMAVMVAGATAASRVIGLVREMLTATFYGTTGEISAYTNIAIFPNLIRALLADAAISAAFVPVFTRLLLKDEKERAFRLASTMISLVALGIGVIVLVFMLVAPYLIKLIYGDFIDKYGYFDLMVLMTEALMPTVILLCTAGVVIGVLYSYERFTMPAVISIVWNVVIIIFLVALAPRIGIWALVWGNVVGTVAELALLVIPLRKLEWRYRLKLDLKDPALKRTLWLMLPVTVALGILNLNALVGQAFAALVSENAPAELYYSFRLYQLPQGVFAIAIGTVLFPTMSRFAARDDIGGFRDTLSGAVRQVFFVTLPFAVWFIAIPTPFVSLIYEHGIFDAQDTASVSTALALFSVGMIFANGNLILNRGFQSLQRPWLPMWVSLFNLGLNALLELASVQAARGRRDHPGDLARGHVELPRPRLPDAAPDRRHGRPGAHGLHRQDGRLRRGAGRCQLGHLALLAGVLRHEHLGADPGGGGDRPGGRRRVPGPGAGVPVSRMWR